MKKAALIFFSITIFSFKIGSDKTYKVELTLQEWQLILNVVDQYNAPHLQVKQVQDLLVPLLNKQIDITKQK
ncbi:MAG: hypothetical protein V4560_14830 [Bacteroidota bacterium]